MIDVMLVLLIIFMIVTPLIAAGFKATLPKGKNLDKDPRATTRSSWASTPAGTTSSTARSDRPRRRSSEQLRAIYAARPEDKILYFKADNQLKFGRVQEGIEIARRAGVRVMAAVTEPQSQGGLFDPTRRRT